MGRQPAGRLRRDELRLPQEGPAQSNPAYDGIPNNVVGLLYRYGIKYDLIRIPNP